MLNWIKDPTLDARLRQLYPLHTNTEIAAMLGGTEPAILNRARLLGLKKPQGFGNAGQFRPGQKTWNAGKKGWQAGGRAKETQFKKGNKPHSWHPVGHERITADGIRQRKMTDTGVTRHDYVNVHWLVWRAAGGEIPPGHVLRFRDGDPTNITIDNLELLSQADNMRRNSFHNYPKPIAELIQLRGALMRKINRTERIHQETTAS